MNYTKTNNTTSNCSKKGITAKKKNQNKVKDYLSRGIKLNAVIESHFEEIEKLKKTILKMLLDYFHSDDNFSRFAVFVAELGHELNLDPEALEDPEAPEEKINSNYQLWMLYYFTIGMNPKDFIELYQRDEKTLRHMYYVGMELLTTE